MIFEDIFRLQIEIELWVAHRIGQGLALFSDELSPPCGTPYSVLSAAMARDQTDFHVPEIIQPFRAGCAHLVLQRRLLLRSMPDWPIRTPRGRWLLYSPDWVDFCQLAHDPGFIDESDAPAWDLWACWGTQNILVSWIPDALVERYNTAMLLSPCGTVCWDDEEHIVRMHGRDFAMNLLRSA